MKKLVNVRLSEKRLREIVTEELSVLREKLDHEAVRLIVTESSKLLKAVEQFKETANVTMTNSVQPHLDELSSTLERMIANPGTYVDKPKPVVKKVTFQPVKTDVVSGD